MITEPSKAKTAKDILPKLSVIIVSYNTQAMTLDCLKALYQGLGGLSAEVFVVDNASADGSPAAIRTAFPEVHLIENTRNAGFGEANNQAMAEARGEFFLLLNSDAFPEPNAIPALVAYLQSHPEAAVAGPRLLNTDGTLQLSCFRFPSPAGVWLENLWISTLLPNHPTLGYYRRWAHDQERCVDFVIGACLLVRREAYEQVGGFDDSFFMYQEETDWQRRMHDRGWQIGFTPSAVVTHLGGASGASEKARINNHFFESMDHYLHKHYGLPGLLSLRLAMFVGCFLRMILWTGVVAAVPKRRSFARSKVRLMSWLCLRSATHWRSSLQTKHL
jgi:GT2 family glycosyltransferase